MKSKIIIIILFLVAFAMFYSCKSEDDTNPIIENLEIGHDDTIHVGEEIHIEFEVSDNEKLDYYTIKIHHEGHDHKSTAEEVAWEFDSTFREIAGLKNYEVHHHEIMVDTNAEEGEYHFDLLVVDEAGNSTSAERDLIMAHDDNNHDDHNHE